MTDRDQEARDAAKERWGDHTEPQVGFMDGVHWADANRPTEPIPYAGDWVADTGRSDVMEAVRRVIARGSYARFPEDLPYADVAHRLVAAFDIRQWDTDESDDDNWEYGIRFGGSEQKWTSTTWEHIEYIAGWHNGIYEFARRRRASEWEPITPRGEEP